MKKVYIAHPLRGAEREKNVEEVTRICQKVVELFPDVLPISPIHAFSFLDDCGEEGEKKALELCLEMIKICDEAWFFGRDWRDSVGCFEEYNVAFGDGNIGIFDYSLACCNAILFTAVGDIPAENYKLARWLLSEVYEPEPKPCPFCGGEAVIEEQPLGHGKIYCAGLDCPIHSMVGYGKGGHCKTRAEAIAAWNRRANDGCC